MFKPLSMAAVLSLLLATSWPARTDSAEDSSPAEIVEPSVALAEREPVEAPDGGAVSEKTRREPVDAPGELQWAEVEASREAVVMPESASGVEGEELDARVGSTGEVVELVASLRRMFVRSASDLLATQLDGCYDGVDEWPDEGKQSAEPLAELDAVLPTHEPVDWSGHDPVLAFLTENACRMNWWEWMDSARARAELTFADEAVPEKDLEVEPTGENVDAADLRLSDYEPDLAFMTDESAWLQEDVLTWRERPCAEFAELFWLGPFAGWPHTTTSITGPAPEGEVHIREGEIWLRAANALSDNDRQPPAGPKYLRYLGEPDRGFAAVDIGFGWSCWALSPPERAPVSFLVLVARREPFPRTWRDVQQEIRRQRDEAAEERSFGFRISGDICH
jgi:hypothetical protein